MDASMPIQPPVEFGGWLKKYARNRNKHFFSFISNWQQRYFILNYGKIYYYKDADKKSKQGATIYIIPHNTYYRKQYTPSPLYNTHYTHYTYYTHYTHSPSYTHTKQGSMNLENATISEEEKYTKTEVMIIHGVEDEFDLLIKADTEVER